MRKIVLAILSLCTLAILVLLIIALTQPTSTLYHYRLIMGLLLLTFGGLLRRHILLYKEDSTKR